jgi:beta-D-xylosidase 4
MENEGCDRTSISLPKIQRSLLATVLDAAKIKGIPVVLVVFSGGAVDLSFAKDAVGVSAILWAGFPGPAGATAIAETLYGRNAPSGRLTQTFYSEGFTNEVAMTDMGMRPGAHNMGRGYRFYTGRAVVYPFGHGMHYTEFELSNAAATGTGVSVGVRNAGSVTSAVALLVFLVPPPATSGGAPKRFLAAYKKLHLTSHQTQKVLLAYYDHALHLARPDGTKELVVGKWTAEFSVGGTSQPLTAKFSVRDQPFSLWEAQNEQWHN